MKTILTVLVTMFAASSDVVAATYSEAQKTITENEATIKSLNAEFLALLSLDEKLQTVSAKLVNKSHLLNNMLIVAEQNKDSLAGLGYFIEAEHFEFFQLPETFQNKRLQEVGAEALPVIFTLIEDLEKESFELPAAPTREDIANLSRNTISVYRAVAKQITLIQFHISLGMQYKKATIAGLKRANRSLKEVPAPKKKQEKVVQRPQDTKHYWNSRGLAVP